jgi:hypothetical protein
MHGRMISTMVGDAYHATDFLVDRRQSVCWRLFLSCCQIANSLIDKRSQGKLPNCRQVVPWRDRPVTSKINHNSANWP